MMQKIESVKISDQIVFQLKNLIRAGDFTSGSKLPSVREMCDMFGVGRTAVRDAITTLKGMGLIEVRRGEGSFVCQYDSADLIEGIKLVNKKDIEQLFHVRKILEVGAAETAAETREEEHLVSMRRALAGTLEEGWEADYDFHMAIAKASQNPILYQIMDSISQTLKTALYELHRFVFTNGQIIESINNEHLAIYQAIERKNPQQARTAMMYHLTKVEKLLNKHVISH